MDFNNNDGLADGTINQPDISTGSLKSKRRAIKDAKQARSIISTLQTANRDRNIKNARIMAKYNADKPYSQQELEAEALGWKSNFTTQPLPRLIDKVAPRFVRAIESVKYLTNSSLPDTEPGAAAKTEAFRREVTKTIRARPGWRSFIAEVAQENALFGYTSCAWLDEFSYFPKHFSQSDFFVPTGTKQIPNSAQIVVFKETFLIHELFSLIEDKEAASAAGWDIKNTVTAINNSIPDDRRSQYSDFERIHEDLIREANAGGAYESGALVVVVFHILAQEVDGKVSHYIFLDEPDGHSSSRGDDTKEALFEREDQFDEMRMAVGFFAFQHGNGKLHGSKGIGRQIYALAAMVDRARNEVVDRLNLSGKIIIQCDDKALRRFKASIVGPALLIGQGYQISERKIETSVKEFLELDQFLTAILDEISGATTPKVFEGERVTKAQVDLFAGREEESRDNIIGRFLGQFAEIMTTIQRRLCDSDTSEKDAKAMQKRLLEVMDRKELNQLAKQPIAETVEDFTAIERQNVVIAAQEARGNPLYSAREMERRKLTAQFSEEFADAVLLPDPDPTIAAEQTRLQSLELLLIIGQATEVPVSPRDAHEMHLAVLMPAMENAAAEAMQNPGGLDVLNALLSHAEAHLKAATDAGAPKELLAQVSSTISKLRAGMQKLNEIASQEAQLGQQQNQLLAGMQPPAQV